VKRRTGRDGELQSLERDAAADAGDEDVLTGAALALGERRTASSAARELTPADR